MVRVKLLPFTPVLAFSMLCTGCTTARHDETAAASRTASKEPMTVAPSMSTPTANKTYAKPPVAELERKLSRRQFLVTQRGGTEPAFQNAYWDNHEAGIYVDIVTGEPLFSSLDKFDSGTGWP